MSSLASLVTTKQIIPPSLHKNTIAISFAIEQSEELSSVFAFDEPCGQNGNNLTSFKHLLHSRFLLPFKNSFLPLSLFILRGFGTLSILNSAESAIIFPNSLPFPPVENMRRII